jgi:hypothetical protein
VFLNATATGATPWVYLTNGLAVQITAPTSGATASSVSAIVQRSTLQPHDDGSGGNPQPVGPLITGDPATLDPQQFDEPAHAWWRVVVTALVAGGVGISIDGGAA